MNDSLAYQLQSAQNDPELQNLLAAAISHNQLSKMEDLLKRKNDTDVQKTPAKHNHQQEKEDDDIDSPEDNSKPTPKRPGRKALTTMPADKRKAQNRAAQRAFRERKDKYVKELEDRVKELEANNDKNQEENEKLRKLLEEVKTENTLLKGNFTFQPPSNALDSAPTLVDLLKNNNYQTDSPLFTDAFPWTPTSNAGEISYLGGSESPENQGLSPSDDKSSPYALSSYTATPEMANTSAANQQSTLSPSPLHETNFFAPIGEIVGDPLISANEGFPTPHTYNPNEQHDLEFSAGLTDYRDVANILFDDSLVSGLSTLPAYLEESWNEEYDADSLFSPLQTSHSEINEHTVSNDGKTNEDKSEDHISLEDCKVLEYASLPLDFDINELCEELRKKATCGRIRAAEKIKQVAQL
ncbi:DNA-binding transcription factor yap1 [Basidiobolus ranarum]|uniref:DNA-binding transcription factor yap1 n=1 Tax=Basidiobolus ranarum TaxID=34480 RepID=A0ABR2WLZ1_9FUNG